LLFFKSLRKRGNLICGLMLIALNQLKSFFLLLKEYMSFT
jgi:hypothetical protein